MKEINKTRIKIFMLFAVMILIGIFCGMIINHFRKGDKVIYITDNEHLYDIAIEYLKEKYTEEEKELGQMEDMQIFFDYEGFGISEKGNKRYAYMWILEEAYYLEDGKLKSGSASSMAYKITFDMDSKVINVEVPEDGTYYVDSIKKMFPDDIEKKILNFQMDDKNLEKQVNDYYKGKA